ncbi:nitroreductase [Sphingomonas flavescens]|uniref:nitroreductase family protein n=1 Tax=Sphingomonas flavescens TaxID=3132797 RepID=UPI002803D0EF|nr:nitroreductase [Sphingomonas limnosediminicola]
MLNDTSSILSLLQTRRSGKPRELVGPGPSPTELEQMLTIAARTPDHGNLEPWRFVIVGDDQRDAFEAVLQRALREEEPDAPAAKVEKEHAFSHYQGALVILISAPVQGHKVPVWEQELSCGSAAMNLLLAAHAFGYVPGWVTGWRTYSDVVRNAFCKADEQIAGFIFIGHESRELEDRPRPALDEVVSVWQPPQ